MTQNCHLMNNECDNNGKCATLIGYRFVKMICVMYMESEAEYPFHKWSKKKEEERAACIIERERKK